MKNNKIWCSSAKKKKNLNKTISKNLESIQNDLKNLLKIEDNRLDINFLDKFFTYFDIDEKCLCNILKSNKFITFNDVKNRFILDKKNMVIKDTLTKLSYIIDESTTINIPEEDISNLKLNHYIDNGKDRVNVSLSKFMNNTIISYIINIIIDEIRRTNHVKILDTFFCTLNQKYIGFSIFEKYTSSIELFNQLFIKSEHNKCLEIAEKLLEQIIGILEKLKQYSFSHGDLVLNNIQFNEKKNEFKVSNYRNSKIVWNGIIFHSFNKNSKNIIPSFFLEERKNYFVIKYNQPFSLTFLKSEIDDFFENMQINLDLKESTAVYNFILMIRNNPILKFESFDIYTLVTSLLVEPIISQCIFSENMQSSFKKSKLFKITQILFYKDDWNILKKRIKKIYQKYTPIDFSNTSEFKDYLGKNDILDYIRKYTTLIYLLYDLRIKKNLKIFHLFEIEKEKKNINFNYPYKFSKSKKLCITKCKKTKNKFNFLKTCETFPIKKYNDDFC